MRTLLGENQSHRGGLRGRQGKERRDRGNFPRSKGVTRVRIPSGNEDTFIVRNYFAPSGRGCSLGNLIQGHGLAPGYYMSRFKREEPVAIARGSDSSPLPLGEGRGVRD